MTKADRIKACELAAQVLASRPCEEPICPLAWSLAVFFESYISKGATATAKEFGPKEPVILKVKTGARQ